MVGIVESIQLLLTSIRAGDDMQTLRKHVDHITPVVWKVLQSTESSMQQPGNETLRDRGGWVVANLRKCLQSMGEISNEGEPIDGPADKEFKARLASLAFDLVREAKVCFFPSLAIFSFISHGADEIAQELVKIVEGTDNESRGGAQVMSHIMDEDSLR